MKAREPFRPMTYNDIGQAHRKMFGGPFYPCVPDKPPREKWFCHSNGCTLWTDESGAQHGACGGACLIY